MPKHKAGTKLKRKGHIYVTILKVTQYEYHCVNTHDTDHKFTLAHFSLDDSRWVVFNPIWLHQKNKDN